MGNRQRAPSRQPNLALVVNMLYFFDFFELFVFEPSYRE